MVSTLLSLSQRTLNLPELSQVQGSNFVSFPQLLLVRLDLSLKVINQTLHALVVLAMLRTTQVLLGIVYPPVLSIHLRFQFPNPGLHLVHSLLSSLESIGFSLIKTLS